MKYAYFWICLFTCFLGVCVSLVAQDSQNPLKDYSFSVILLDYDNDAINKGKISQLKWCYFSEKTPYKCNLFGGRLSTDFFYKGLNQLTFFKEELGAEGEKLYEPKLKVALGNPGRKLIVIFGNGKGNYRGLALEIGENKLPQDQLMMINLSKQPVMAKVGERQSLVNAMDSFNFKVSGPTKRFRLPLAMAMNKEGRVKVIEKRKMSFTQGGRKVMLLYPDRRRPNNLTYSIYNVVDLPPREFYSEEFEDVEAFEEFLVE